MVIFFFGTCFVFPLIRPIHYRLTVWCNKQHIYFTDIKKNKKIRMYVFFGQIYSAHLDEKFDGSTPFGLEFNQTKK